MIYPYDEGKKIYPFSIPNYNDIDERRKSFIRQWRRGRKSFLIEEDGNDVDS